MERERAIDSTTGEAFRNSAAVDESELIKPDMIGSGISTEGRHVWLIKSDSGDVTVIEIKSERVINKLITSLEQIRFRMRKLQHG